jgi:sec-independent protein translocase protein TatB
MSVFGIGPMELVFILIIMILVLGPKNMVESAKKFGITLRKIVKSPLWATVMDTSREIREIPTRLIREAGIEEDLKNIKSTTDSLKNVGNFSVPIDPVKVNLSSKVDDKKENKILPEQPAENQPDTNELPSADTNQVNDSEMASDETPETTDTNL